MSAAWTALPVALALLLADPAAAATRRFALVVGANQGGLGRVQLRYANSDAEAFAAVLEQLGGVTAEDRLLLLEARREDVIAGLAELNQRLRRARAGDERLELLFYYSGHSDEQGLLLQGERLDFRQLRRQIDALPADVRVAIVDACASGSLTRFKGGVRRPPFLIDRSSQVKGLAIITSSSASEVSQESDSLGASFFTHYLISGLRGAADGDADGRITLAEAYQFTFHRTLARTEKTQGGAQHPAYDMQLAGSGDLVLTDLRGTSAGLLLDEALVGTVFLRDPRGQLVVELDKQAGRPVELGLPPGAYQIVVERGDAAVGGEVRVAPGAPATLQVAGLRPVPRESTVSRGGLGGYQRVPVELSLLPIITTNGFFGGRVINHFSLSLVAGRAARVHGLGIGLLAHWVDEQLAGMQLTLGANIVGGEALGLQLAGLANLIREPSTALQLSPGANLAGANLSIGQLSLGTNLAGGQLRGVQALAAFNLAGGGLVGAQLASGFNTAAGEVVGLQLAPGGNLAIGRVLGAQLSAVGVNVAGGHVGAQLGPVNLSQRVIGAQLGLVNIAGEVSGAQLGLVNIAEKLDGAPLGLVNVIGDGMFHPQLWIDDTALLNLALKHGGQRFYSQLLLGFQPVADPVRGQLGLGAGARFRPAEQLFVDLDLSLLSLHRGGLNLRRLDLLGRLQAQVGYALLPRLGFVAGLALNGLVSELDEPGLSIVPAWVLQAAGPQLALWPGVHLGMQF